MSAYPSVRALYCHYCGALPGAECVTSGGRPSDPHSARWGSHHRMLRSGTPFIVRIKETDPHVGVIEGEEYAATAYWLDPGKVTLLHRIPDGHNPECNQYTQKVEFVRWEGEPR